MEIALTIFIAIVLLIYIFYNVWHNTTSLANEKLGCLEFDLVQIFWLEDDGSICPIQIFKEGDFLKVNILNPDSYSELLIMDGEDNLLFREDIDGVSWKHSHSCIDLKNWSKGEYVLLVNKLNKEVVMTGIIKIRV